MIFYQFCLDCVLILQFLHLTCAMSSNTTHLLNFGLPVLLSPLPPGLAQRTFFAGSLFHHHMFSPTKCNKFNKFCVILIILLLCIRVFVPPSKSIFKCRAKYFPWNFPLNGCKKILTMLTHSLRLRAIFEHSEILLTDCFGIMLGND